MGKIEVTVGIPTHNRERWLRESVASVLAQSMTDFRLLISDNASDDATRASVESFGDPRIDYRRSEVDVGMTNNLNRIIELTDTEFLIILPDDDLLYPDYLLSAVEVLKSNPGVGVVHTAFDLVDSNLQVIERGRKVLKTREPVAIERGRELIERGMRSSGIVCWSSALFRMSALTATHGLRVEEEPFADAPLMMRIGVDWDFACISRPLVAVRMHENASSAEFTTFTGKSYDPDDTIPESLFRQRISFLDAAELPASQDQRYRALAERTFRRDTIGRMTIEVGTTRSRSATLQELARLGRADIRILFVPGILKLGLALLAGRPLTALAVWPRRR